MSLLTVSYVFSVAFLFQLFLVSHIVCHRIIFDSGAVRGILSSSQAEPSQLVPPTALGNVHTPDGNCGNHRNMGGQHRARVRGMSSVYLSPRLPSMHTQPHLPWCFCRVFRGSFHWLVRNKCSANHSEACSTILLG